MSLFRPIYAVVAAAVLAAAAISVVVSRPGAPPSPATVTAVDTRGPAPGWRVISPVGPVDAGVSGTITANSAKSAWSAWRGTGLTRVLRWTGNAWANVPVPAGYAGYVRTAIAFGGDSPRDFWLLSSKLPAGALRWTGSRWTLRAIPSWALRRTPSGALKAAISVFAPGNVWLFSLGRGAYAAHYDGRAWTRVTLPGVPTDVSATGPGAIDMLGNGSVFHWTGEQWVNRYLPAIPLASGASVSYGDLVSAPPSSGWVVRTISFKTAPSRMSLLHWTSGGSWTTVASPADIIGSIAPDGSGGLWATGIDINPAGLWLLYHRTGSHWTVTGLPAGVDPHAQKTLTWIPGTRSLWGTASTFGTAGSRAVILKYGA